MQHDGAQPWSVELQLSGFGRTGAMQPPPPLSAAPEVMTNRVRLPRLSGLDEWYLNGPRGLEQGFTIQHPPRGAAHAELVLEVTVKGELAPVLLPGNQGIQLRTADGHHALRYTDLVAHDAIGRMLPSWMRAVGQRIELHVDDAEALYPIVVDPLVWKEAGKLIASDGNSLDFFGGAADLDQTTAIIGAALGGTSADANQGAAYVFVRAGPSSWSLQDDPLIASNGLEDDGFGTAVAVDGNTALVGAPGKDFSGENSGEACVFARSGENWATQKNLMADDGEAGDQFGTSVALDGDYLLIGAPFGGVSGSKKGAAYVFKRAGLTWSFHKKLLADIAKPDDEFGAAVALSGNTALVGAPKHNVGGSATHRGAAYVFVRSGDNWSQQAKLVDEDGAQDDELGISVALDGDTAIVGATGDDDVASNAGAAFVFTRNGTDWAKQGKLAAGDGKAGDALGGKVALFGDLALLSAPNDGKSIGAAYLFQRSGGSWTELDKFSASDGMANGYFGSALALSDDTAIVGATGDNPKGSYSGSAYIFRLALDNGDECTDNSQCQSLECSDGYCCDSEKGSCSSRGTACLDDVDCANGKCVDGTEVSHPRACEGHGVSRWGHKFDLTVELPAVGSFDGDKLELNGTSWSETSQRCAPRRHWYRYYLDNFTGQVSADGHSFHAVNNDGARAIDAPYSFQRISCL